MLLEIKVEKLKTFLMPQVSVQKRFGLWAYKLSVYDTFQIINVTRFPVHS